MKGPDSILYLRDLDPKLFTNDYHYKNFCEMADYFQYIGSLQDKGYSIFVNGEYVNGKFGVQISNTPTVGTWDINEHNKTSSVTAYLGSEWNFNEETGEYDLLYCKSLKNFKKHYIIEAAENKRYAL